MNEYGDEWEEPIYVFFVEKRFSLGLIDEW